MMFPFLLRLTWCNTEAHTRAGNKAPRPTQTLAWLRSEAPRPTQSLALSGGPAGLKKINGLARAHFPARGLSLSPLLRTTLSPIPARQSALPSGLLSGLASGLPHSPKSQCPSVFPLRKSPYNDFSEICRSRPLGCLIIQRKITKNFSR